MKPAKGTSISMQDNIKMKPELSTKTSTKVVRILRVISREPYTKRTQQPRLKDLVQS
jgi:hypothetical protein